MLRHAVAYLPEVTSPPIALRVLRSGRTILYTPRFADAAFEARVYEHLATPQTTLQLAAAEQLPLALLSELLHTVAQQTTRIVRDDCDLRDTRWFRNTLLLAT